MQALLALSIVAFAIPASASGWNDYRLEIAPGFSVERMNSFEVCLAGREGLLLVCPDPEHPSFGPLVAYAVRDDAILTRHLGARPDARNPSLWQADPSRKLFFFVRREDENVSGPLTRESWTRAGLPALASVRWEEPRNPNVWTPLLGDLLFLALAAVHFGWPLLGVALVASGAFWLHRREKA